MTWIEEFDKEFTGDELSDLEIINIKSFITRNRQELLTELLAQAESMDTAKEVRHLIKEYIFHD